MSKPSFLERLTGSVNIENEDFKTITTQQDDTKEDSEEETSQQNLNEDSEEGTLSIDMYENQNEIIITTVTAGTRPEELDVTITRDKVSVKGKRVPSQTIKSAEIHLQELYWGSFSRTVNLPEEIEVDEAEAVEKYGLLIIRLPKINKDRETKLRVKEGK